MRPASRPKRLVPVAAAAAAAAILALSPGLAAIAQEGSGATAAPAPAASPAVAMTPQQVETVLRARGYDRIEGLSREAPDRYRLERAHRFGEPVPGPLVVDAATSRVLDEPPLTEAQARTLLRARGYAEVPEVRRDGDALLARALREGAEVTLRIDPHTGAVRPQRD
jgi:hypothetical protein